MKEKLKRLAIHLFLGDKFRGRLSTVVAGAAASYLMAYIPGSPAFVEFLVRLIMDLPDGVEFTHTAVAASLAVPVSYVIDAVIQEFLIRENNKALSALRPVYEGEIDGFVGPVARHAIEKLLQFPENKIQDER